MAKKGDRAVLEPAAMRLYAEGHNLSAIAERLGVSVTSLSRWKEASRKAGADADEWDRARSQKRGNVQRLRDLFEEQLRYLEDLPPGERTAPALDALAKLGSILERWDKIRTVAEPKAETPEEPENRAPDAADIARWKEMMGL